MFSVKATYRNETRRFTFPESVLFPTYEELHNQLYRLFPISHNYYLSRLIFSPDTSKPGRILIGREVHSAEDYDSHTAPLRRVWPNPLLRFVIFDGTSPKEAPSVASGRLSLYSAPTIPLPDISSKSPSPVVPPVGRLNSQSFMFPPPPPPQSTMANYAPHPSYNMSPVPPPPIIFSPPFKCSTAAPAPCCSITKGKEDIGILLSSFKEDLERILSSTFGTGYMEQQSASLFRGPTCRRMYDANSVPPVNVSTSALRWCFVCRTSFTGIWYGCIKCPWHAVCPSCFSKSHSAHTLSFGPSHVVEQRSTHCSTRGSAQIPGETMPSARVSGVSPPPRAAASSVVGKPAHAIHRGITCDGCKKTVVGIRHKCMNCPDYDLCTPCMEPGAAEQHNPFHEFFDIETPERVYIHSVLGRDRDRSLGHRQQVSSSDHAQVTPQGPVTIQADSPVRHNATCNLCDSVIVGERYKCVVCPDFDTCSSCFRITTEQHPNHGFVRVNKPEDLMARGSIPLRQAAHLAVCDSCQNTIRGARYKCMHQGCPDFDLCSDCEALPIPVHPLNHPMLKLRTSDTVVPTVYRVGQTQMIDESSAEKPVSVCGELHASLSRSPLATPMKSPEPAPVVVSAPPTNSAVEEQTLFAEEFLSPLASPVISVPGKVPTSVTIAPSQLVDVVERPESPSDMDICHQLWSRLNQEMTHLNTMEVLQAEDRDVNSTENTIPEPVASDAPTSSASLACPVSPVSGTRSIVDGYCTPSPMSTNVQESHPIAQQLVVDDEHERAVVDAPQQSHLDSAVMGDINVPEGQIFPPGAEFVKGWHVVNNGGQPWPMSTEIQFVTGEMFAPESSVVLRATVGIVSPGQDFDVWTGDLKAPDVPGRYAGYWRLNDGQGNFFGNGMWINLTVADHYSDQASEHSLAASSMVMPSPHPANSVNASEELRDAPRPSLPSTETVLDEGEDHESDISSVYLVSVPTSDEDVEWQDSRTHSEPLEYVVLYDSNSEE